GYVVSPVVPIDHRVFRIVSHAAGTQQVHLRVRWRAGNVAPALDRAGCLEQLERASQQEFREPAVVGMLAESDLNGGQTPGVLERWVECDGIALHRQLGG